MSAGSRPKKKWAPALANKLRALPFRDPGLLEQALTHRSAGSPHYERLEFLGDAVVNLIVAEALVAHWPRADEGSLTRARAELVRESALAGIARSLNLGTEIRFGPGELKSGGHRRESILADVVEAIIGAVYVDAGWDAARALAMPWFEPLIAALPAADKVGKDPKTRLQEWLQGRGKPLPHYDLLAETGEEHARTFEVRCVSTEPAALADGHGSSRRAAEQMAAAAVLAQLEG